MRKVRGLTESEELRRRLGLSRGLWLAVGVLELCAVVGLLAGLIAGPLGVATAVGVALLMVGAVAFHTRVHLVGKELAPPLAVL